MDEAGLKFLSQIVPRSELVCSDIWVFFLNEGQYQENQLSFK